MTYRILPNTDQSPARIAMAPRRSTLEGAVADMGQGLVIDSEDRVVAFHERHLAMVERGYGTVTA